jgi:hypothetical protein
MVECFRRCQFCNNIVDLTQTYVHDNCEDYYTFILDEMLAEARKKVEMLLLKRKLLILFKDR